MKAHVLKGKILVKKFQAENKTKGGIILPEPYIEPPNKGTVVLVGSGSEHHPMELTVGDEVLYAEHAGTPIHVDEEDLDLNGGYILLDQQNVLIFKR